MKHRLPLGIVLVAISIAAVLLASTGHAQSPPAGYSEFYNGVSVWVDGSNVVLQTSAIPDHNSPYFPVNDPRHEAYSGPNPNYQQNPNTISAQTLEFRIPANPQPAATHPATPLGPIGIGLDGIPLFNQYAGPNQPLTNEINSFDQYNSHPQMTGMYHCHIEPLAITDRNGRDALVGFLLDGYPVYGPIENNVEVTNANLDQHHGHSHATAEYPSGIYHYHITAAAPYIAGTGFFGTAGMVSMSQSPTPTPVISGVGGVAELPSRSAGDANAASGDSSSGAVAVAIAGGALLAGVVAGGWFAMRRMRRGR